MIYALYPSEILNMYEETVYHLVKIEEEDIIELIQKTFGVILSFKDTKLDVFLNKLAKLKGEEAFYISSSKEEHSKNVYVVSEEIEPTSHHTYKIDVVWRGVPLIIYYTGRDGWYSYYKTLVGGLCCNCREEEIDTSSPLFTSIALHALGQFQGEDDHVE